jgi:hypothetical protein
VAFTVAFENDHSVIVQQHFWSQLKKEKKLLPWQESGFCFDSTPQHTKSPFCSSGWKGTVHMHAEHKNKCAIIATQDVLYF